MPNAYALLERLGHHDVIDAGETHSRNSARLGREGDLIADLAHGTGAHRLWNFRALHHDALTSARARLKSAAGADALALRGRLSRLLGDAAAARADFSGSLKIRESARALGWRGELALASGLREAEDLLRRAARLDGNWPWPRLWLGLAGLKAKAWDQALLEFDAFLERCPRGAYSHHCLRFRALLSKGDVRAAHEEALKAAAREAATPAGAHMAGQALWRLKDFPAAEASFHRARNLDMEVVGSYIFEGLGIVLDWNRPEAYRALLDRAIRRRPDCALLYAERAELKRHPRFCLYQEALSDYETAARLEPRCAWISAVVGRAKNNLSGGTAGLAEFDRAVALAPESGWMLAWRGAALARLGRVERAFEDFDRSEALMPWHSFTYAWRGALLNRRRRFARARRDLDLAIRLDPHYPFSFNERFRSRRALKDYEGAAEDLNRAFSSDPKYAWTASSPRSALRELALAARAHPGNPWLPAWRGTVSLSEGKARAALADLDRAVALAPADAVLRAWRGRARRGAGDMKGAVSDLSRALRLDPRSAVACGTLAEVRRAQGALRAALRLASRAVSLAPTTAPYFYLKASIEHELGLPREALADLQRTVELERGFAGAYVLMAEVRLGQGRMQGALEDIERALGAADPPGRAFLVRGMIREKLGDPKGQITDFKKALELAPELFAASERREVERLIAGGVDG